MVSAMNNWDNGARMTDVRAPEDVEVKISRGFDGNLNLWVNINGVCRLRAYSIKAEAYHYVEDSHGRD